MDIKQEILKGHSKNLTLTIAKHVGNNSESFDELMDLFFSTQEKIAQRASWVVSACAEEHPLLLLPYLGQMIENLANPVHDAVKRNTLRAFQFIEFPSELLGRVTHVCFHLLGSKDSTVAIKAFAMSVLFNSCKKEPGLQNELMVHIEEQMPYASPAFTSRGRKILKEIKKTGLKQL